MEGRRTVFVTLWKGEGLPSYSQGQYGVEDVVRLWHGMRRHIPNSRLVVLCDDESFAELCCFAIPKELEHPDMADTSRLVQFEGFGVGGWTNVLEAMNPDLYDEFVGGDGSERALLVGLDTVFTGDCEWLFEWDEAPIGLPLDPYNSSQPCDAVVTFDRKGATLAWVEFMAARQHRKFPHLYAGRPSEMVLLQHLWKIHGWPMLETTMDRLKSFKGCNLRDAAVCPDASLVYFHGRPKIRELATGHPVRVEWEHTS